MARHEDAVARLEATVRGCIANGDRLMRLYKEVSEQRNAAVKAMLALTKVIERTKPQHLPQAELVDAMMAIGEARALVDTQVALHQTNERTRQET